MVERDSSTTRFGGSGEEDDAQARLLGKSVGGGDVKKVRKKGLKGKAKNLAKPGRSTTPTRKNSKAGHGCISVARGIAYYRPRRHRGSSFRGSMEDHITAGHFEWLRDGGEEIERLPPNIGLYINDPSGSR